MLNPGHIQFLDSLIGKDGIYFRTIVEESSYDVSTKVLYLKRAVSQESSVFYDALDKLYIPQSNKTREDTQLEFLHALKIINDMCFNNNFFYAVDDTRSTLSHVLEPFGKLSEEDRKAAKLLVRTRIFSGIASLSKDYSELTMAIKKRRQEERTLETNTFWRKKLGVFLNPGVEVSIGSRLSYYQNSERVPRIQPESRFSYADQIAVRTPLQPICVPLIDLPVNLPVRPLAERMLDPNRGQAVALAERPRDLNRGPITYAPNRTHAIWNNRGTTTLFAPPPIEHPLGNPLLNQLIEMNLLDYHRCTGLRVHEINKIEFIFSLIINQFISVEDCLRLSPLQFSKLSRKGIIDLVLAGELAISEVALLSFDDVGKLCSTSDLIIRHQLRCDEVFELTAEQIKALSEVNSEEIRPSTLTLA